MGRFHALWRREDPTSPEPQPPEFWSGTNLTGDANYVILDAEGQGNYVGFVLGVDNLVGSWWGEGDDMVKELMEKLEDALGQHLGET